MSHFTRVLAALTLAASIIKPALAHMEMTVPPPLRSKINPQYAGSPLIDYSHTAPLSNDGSNFPCKGYAVDVPSVSHAVATLEAGKNFTVNIAGGAPHEGGSCQFSLSYDGGKSWGVVHSVVGGCPLDPAYSFPIPAGIPSGKDVLLSWSWFNLVGNHEMYQNCAAVDVKGGNAPLALRKMFRANTFGGGECLTIEGTAVDFENPAGSVTNCPADKLVTPDQKVTLSPRGSPAPAPDAPEPEAPTSTKASTTTEAPSSTESQAPSPTHAPGGEDEGDDPCPPENDDGQDDGEDCNGPCPPEVDDGDEPGDEAGGSGSVSAPVPTPSTPVPAPAPAPAPPTAPPTDDSGSCVPGAILCSKDGLSWSMCAFSKWVPMGSVAAGMRCVNGEYVGATRRAPSRIYGRGGLAPADDANY